MFKIVGLYQILTMILSEDTLLKIVEDADEAKEAVTEIMMMTVTHVIQENHEMKEIHEMKDGNVIMNMMKVSIMYTK